MPLGFAFEEDFRKTANGKMAKCQDAKKLKTLKIRKIVCCGQGDFRCP